MISEYTQILRQKNVEEILNYIDKIPIGWLVAFHAIDIDDKKRETIFHTTPKVIESEQLFRVVWNHLFNRFGDFGKQRILGTTYRSSESKTVIELLLSRKDNSIGLSYCSEYSFPSIPLLSKIQDSQRENIIDNMTNKTLPLGVVRIISNFF